MAAARGCSDDCSRAAARAKTWSWSPITSVTTGLPVVIVPVLSNTTVLIPAAACNASPFLIRTPSLAARVVPTINAVGVASPRAHGQAITMTATAKSMARIALTLPNTNQAVKVVMAAMRTAGTKIPATRSVSFWMGAWLVWARFTIVTIWASMV